MPTFNEFVAEGKARGKTKEQVAKGVEMYRIRYGQFDDEVATTNISAANASLTDSGFFASATPEQKKAVTDFSAPDSMELYKATGFYSNKYGIMLDPIGVQAMIEMDYGMNATPQVANAENLKARKWTTPSWEQTTNITDATGITVSLPGSPAAGYRAPERREGENVFAHFVANTQTGLAAIPEWYASTMQTLATTAQDVPEVVSQYKTPGGFANELARVLMEPDNKDLPMRRSWEKYQRDLMNSTAWIPHTKAFKALREVQESGAKTAEAARDEYTGGTTQSLRQSLKEGNYRQFGQDLADAINLEMPNFLTLAGLATVNPALGLAYAGGTSGGQRYAEGIQNGESPSEAAAKANIYAIAEVAFELGGSTGQIAKLSKGAKKEAVFGFAEKLTSLLREPASEIGTQMIQNITDGKPWNEGLEEAGLIGAIMGAPLTITEFRQHALTKGDANRIRQQHTPEEVAAIAQATPEINVTPERVETFIQAATKADEASVEEYNRELFERPLEAEREGVTFEGMMEGIDVRQPVFAAVENGIEVSFPVQPNETIAEAKAKAVENAMVGGGVKPQPVVKDSLTTHEQVESEDDIVTPETAQLGDIVGISRKSNNEFRKALGETELDETEREMQVETLQKAIDEGIVADADILATEINATPRELKAEEVAGLLMRKAELSNEIESIQSQIAEAEKAGDMAAVNRGMARLDQSTQQALSLTTAVTKGAAKNARALAAMAMHMDRKTFTLVNIVTSAVKAKGAALTESERAELQEMHRTLQATEARIKQLEAEFDAKLEAEAKKIAEEILKTTLAQRTTVQRRTKAEKKRTEAKNALKKLQWQVNDITGVPFKVAQALKDIAVSHIMDGATTLEEVVRLVQKDVPDTRVTAKVIYDSLGGRVKKEAKQAKSDAEAYVAELKKQARLQGEIADAMEGLFNPKRTNNPTSREVSELKAKLKELRNSAFKTEQDEAKVEAIEKRIEAMDDMIDSVYRPIKRVVTKSKEVKAAEEKLKMKGKELSAQDRIALLEEILRGDVVQPQATKESPAASLQLEKFRARIDVLQELIRKGKHEASIDSRIDDLTREIETFTRDIRPPAKPKSDYRADELKALQKAKRDQDAIADLLETIRNRTVSAPVARMVSEDKAGYEAMKKALREEIRKSVWYQDQKELAALELANTEIAELDRRLAEGDFEGMITPRQERVIKNQDLIYAKIERNRLRKEVNRRIEVLKPKTWKDKLFDIYEIPRTAKLTADVGHIWRQGGWALSNPFRINPFKFSGQSFAALFRQEAADVMELRVQESEYYKQGQVAGLHLAQQGMGVGETEMIISGELLRKIPGVKQAVKASERAQIAGINLLRQSLFDGFMERNPDTTLAEQKEVAEYINISTGYGMGKIVNGIASVTSKAFTSMRFTSSRYQLAGMPIVGAGLGIPGVGKYQSKALKKEIMQDALWFYGIRAALLALLASAFDDKGDLIDIGMNPDHHTYGRLIVNLDNGISRVYDPWAGLQRMARIARKIQTGEGDLIKVLLEDLGKSVHPTLAAVHSIVHGKKYPGEDVSRGEAAIRSVTPISIESTVDSFAAETGPVDLLFSTWLDLIGIGSYTMETKDLEGKTSYEDRNTDEEKSRGKSKMTRGQEMPSMSK